MSQPKGCSRRSFTLVLSAGVLPLASCGGGGGGDSAGPPRPTEQPPTAALEVVASSTQIEAGSVGVSLSAQLLNSSSPVVWSFAGPGSLSAIRGNSNRYIPPSSSDLLVPTSVTITASSRDLVRSVEIHVLPAADAPRPNPGNRWEVVRPPKFGFSDLKLLEGRFFVCSTLGSILNSPDGINWTARTTPPGVLHSIIHGNGTYLAVGRNSVFRSSDGDTWTSTGPQGEFEFLDVAAGNGAFVANGSRGLARSVDGTAWTTVGLRDTNPGSSITFGAGRFVAVDFANRVLTSESGIEWSDQTPVGTGQLQAVMFGGGKFLLLGTDQNYLSADGVNWSAVPKNGSKGLKLRYGDGRFFALGIGEVWESVDGRDWSLVYQQPPSGLMTGMAFSEGRYVVAESSGLLAYRSERTLVLTEAWSGPRWLMTAVIVANGQFYAVSEAGHVLRSADGKKWESIGDGMPAVVRGLAHGGGVFVVASEGGPFPLLRSEDGRRWLGVSLSPPDVRLASVVYGAGRFVAGTNTGQFFHSVDGLLWTAASRPVNVEVTAIAYGAGLFVALTVQGHILTSPDGDVWSVRFSAAERLRAVTFGSAGFVAVGGTSEADGAIWTSPDGLAWTRLDTGTALPSLHAATFGNARYLVTGRDGSIFISSDARLWERRSAGIYPFLVSAAASAGCFVAVGSGGAIVASVQ